MYEVPLTVNPNQRRSFTQDGAFWELFIYQATTGMACRIRRNGVNLIQGSRCPGLFGLLPYPYMYEPNYGNLVFNMDADWQKFNGDCRLYYLNNEEYKAWQEYLLTVDLKVIK